MNDGFDISQSFEKGVDRIFEYLPQVLGAALLLIIGYIIATVLRSVAKKALKSVRFDRSVNTSPAGSTISRFVDSPSKLVGKIVFWVVWLGFISLAVSALNLPALTSFVNAIYGYVPSVIAAIVIFLVASAVSAGAASFVQRVMGNTPTSKLFATIIPTITMSIAVFMILNELQIAEDIVNITYLAIMGTATLSIGLAFGLGGKDVASRILEQAYIVGQRNAENVKYDMQRAKQNTKQSAKKLR